MPKKITGLKRLEVIPAPGIGVDTSRAAQLATAARRMRGTHKKITVKDYLQKRVAHVSRAPDVQAVVFTPFDIPGMVTYLDASLLSGYADTDPVGTWTDTSGNACHATAAGTARPLYKTAQLGTRPVLRLDGVNDIMSVTVPASPIWTIAAIVRHLPSVDSNQRFWALHTFSGLFNNAYGSYDDQKNFGWYSNEAAAIVQLSRDARAWSPVITTLTATAANIYCDNILMASAFDPADNFVTSVALTIGGLVGQCFLTGDIAFLVAYNRVLTTYERSKLADWMNNYMSNPLVFFDGDSLLDETFTDIATVIMTALGSGYSKTNWAISGQTLAVCYTNRANITALASTFRKGVVVIWAGTNDVVVGTSSADIITLITNYCTAMKTAGFKVVVLNILARAGLTAPLITVRSAVNASIAANFHNYADAFVDVTANAHLQDPTNETYFNADHIHLIAAGWNIVAALIATAVQGV